MHRLATALTLTAAAAAQIPTEPHLVLTQLPGGNPAAQLLAVDPASGQFQALGRFASDVLAPLAVTLDPFDGSPIVALVLSSTQSRVVRLEQLAGVFVEFHVADVSGPVTGLAVQQDSVLASVDGASGGLYRMPRRGGPASLIVAQANATALQSYWPSGTLVVLAWTGRPGTGAIDSGVVLLNASTGATPLGPFTFPNPHGLELTGVFALVPNHLLSFADGRFARVGVAGTSQPVPTSPLIPRDGAVALQPRGPFSPRPLGLGGALYPFLYEVDPWSGFTTQRSVALPGTPVDFVAGPEQRAQGLRFGQRCGPTSLTASWTGTQHAGGTLTLAVLGPPNDHAVLAIGLSDFLLGSFPFALPGGCPLEVSPDAVVLHLLGNDGSSSQPIAVPPGPAFLGLRLFNQWLNLGAAGVSVSEAASHRIGV